MRAHVDDGLGIQSSVFITVQLARLLNAAGGSAEMYLTRFIALQLQT